jgi:hypothetical protein
MFNVWMSRWRRSEGWDLVLSNLTKPHKLGPGDLQKRKEATGRAADDHNKGGRQEGTKGPGVWPFCRADADSLTKSRPSFMKIKP